MLGSKLGECFFFKIEHITVLKKWGYPCEDDRRQKIVAKQIVLFFEIFFFEFF